MCNTNCSVQHNYKQCSGHAQSKRIHSDFLVGHVTRHIHLQIFLRFNHQQPFHLHQLQVMQSLLVLLPFSLVYIACLYAGIGLFEVDKKDHVMKFDDVDAVSVFKYRHQIEGQPPAFLQCGGFIYPLIPGQSPVLKSGDKMYMFPDLRKEGKGSLLPLVALVKGCQYNDLFLWQYNVCNMVIV